MCCPAALPPERMARRRCRPQNLCLLQNPVRVQKLGKEGAEVPLIPLYRCTQIEKQDRLAFLHLFLGRKPPQRFSIENLSQEKIQGFPFWKTGHCSRPALAPSLPTVKGKPVILCDCGANVDCKPLNLLHFAIMASAFSSAVTDAVKPVVGLLSNGAEAKKGNELNKEAYALLSECPHIDFRGNCEARDLLSGDFDVVVSDGFNGNIALKSAEGTAGAIFSVLMDGIKKGGLRAKLGALMLKPVLKGVKNKMDYNSQGGACFLGLNKVVVKAHGAAKRKSVCAAILQARKLAKSGVVEKIRAYVRAVGESEPDAQ